VLLAAPLALAGQVQPCATAGSADAPAGAGAEYRYLVSARVRPLLFWIGRNNVGDGRIALRNWNDRGREYELLIGSDPGRAPFEINRWGYLLERVSPDLFTIVGVMTESKEASVEQAQARVSSPGSKASRFVAIRARVQGGEAHAAVQRALLPATLTMRDVEAVLARFPESAMTARPVSLPAAVSGGFLSTVAGLVDDSVQLYRKSGRPPSRLRRSYVHGATIHELVLSSSAPVTFQPRGPAGRALESEFEVRTAGRSGSRFRMTYETEGALCGVPLRIVYRPKWWFEAELVIQLPGA
jgi:hypothetical protein